MVTIKNPSLAGERLTTQYGVFEFDANGMVEVPEELAKRLITISGFSIVDEPPDEPIHPSITLDGGVVWQKTDEGYIVSNDVITFTITGSAIDNNLPPNNVEFQDGVLILDENIDINNLHVKGVSEGETILVGADTYSWEDVDGNLDNGYELKFVEPIHTLPGGGSYTPIEGGYVLEGDGDSQFTISGDHLDVDHISIVNDQLLITEGADIDNLVVIGVNENDTIQIGNDTYKWVPATDDLNDGMKLEYVPPVESLPGGGTYYPIDVGYVISDPAATFTLTGDSFDFDHISVQNGKLVLQEGIDTSNLHVKGVAEGDTIQIGTSIYKWDNADDSYENGYELILVSKDGWHTIEGGYVYDKDETAYTLLGSAFSGMDVIPNNVIIADGKISLSPNIDKQHVHILGVIPKDTIQIGDTTYVWENTDDNVDNGLELQLVNPSPDPQPEIYTLDGGGNYVELADGGYKLYDDTGSYSIISGNFDVDHISVQNGKLVLQEGIDTSNLHILGVVSGDTIQIGDNTYKWDDVDDNPSNGLELSLVETYTTLPAGGRYAVINGKFIVTDGKETFSLVLGTVDINQIGVKNGKLMILPGVNIEDIHVIGVVPGDTIQIGDNFYKWEDTDVTAEGYELTLIPKSPWEKDENGIVYHSATVDYTVSGSAINFDDATSTPLNVSVVGGNLRFDPTIDVTNISVIGVEENSTIQIGDNTYIWVDSDTTTSGLELALLEDVSVDGFEYNFDGKQFTVEGGINSDVTVEQLNTGVDFDKDGNLTIGKDIVTSADKVHIQGLQSGATVNVAGENYTLMDTDNNLENGYELVGGTDDAFNWKWSNRNRPTSPQIWRHYTNDIADIRVQGVSARPTYIQNTSTLNLIGDEIISITNSTDKTIKLAGDISGVLSPGTIFTLKNGVTSTNENSFVYLDGILYVPNGSISGISGDLQFTLTNKKLTITSGTLNTDQATISGNAFEVISVSNKNFLVSGNKLIKNAFSKRRSIRV